MKSAALSVFFCVCAGAQPGSFEGVAVHAVTGQPLSGVHIRLVTGSFDTANTAYGAMSDSAGHFSMAQVAAGTYMVTAERTGFVYVQKAPVVGPASRLAIKAGERLTDLKLQLAPRATVAGRVVDEYGDPVQSVSVMLEPVSKEMASGMFGGMNYTDDRGEFRLRAGPGKYRVRASPRDIFLAMESDGGSKPVFGPTYFPNTANREQASVVDVGAGAEIGGVEIRLTPRTGFTIAGAVSGIPVSRGPGMGMVNVMVQYGDRPHRVSRTMGRGVQGDGKFSFPMNEPGYYKVFAYSPNGKPPLQSAAVEFKLDSDVTNLQLNLAPGGEITGAIEFAGGGALAKGTVRLKAVMAFGRVPSGEIDKDGAFRIANVLPDRYQVIVDPLPENSYLKTVQVDGAPAAGGTVDFSGGARDAKLKITVGRNGGQVAGYVAEPGGQRSNSPVASVYLMDDPDNVRPEQSARVTADGRYSFKSIRPGKYRLFAIDPFRDGAGHTPDGLQERFQKAEEIEIKEGDRITKDAKVMVIEGKDGSP